MPVLTTETFPLAFILFASHISSSTSFGVVSSTFAPHIPLLIQSNRTSNINTIRGRLPRTASIEEAEPVARDGQYDDRAPAMLADVFSLHQQTLLTKSRFPHITTVNRAFRASLFTNVRKPCTLRKLLHFHRRTERFHYSTIDGRLSQLVAASVMSSRRIPMRFRTKCRRGY